MLAVGSLFLVGVGPRLLPYETLVVRSGSMAPALSAGDLLVLHPVAAADLRVGDVITFQHPARTGELVTHRIVGVDEAGFVTKGDANGALDPWRVPAVGNGWALGVSVPYAGYAVAAVESTEARVLLFVVPVLLLGALALVEIWRPRRELAPQRL